MVLIWYDLRFNFTRARADVLIYHHHFQVISGENESGCKFGSWPWKLSSSL